MNSRTASDATTLVTLLEESARRHGDKTALSIRDGLRTMSWSFSQLSQRVDAVATFLRTRTALAPTSPVLIWAQNSPATVASLLGVMRAGHIAVPLDRGSSMDFLHNVAGKTDAALLLADSPLVKLPGLDTHDVRVVCMEQTPGDLWERFGPDRIAEIVFTSGTTGSPKGAVLTHGNIIANVKSVSAVVPADTPMRLLSVLPLSHMLEQTVGLYLPMLMGGSVHYMSTLRPPAVVREMRRQRITGFVTVPRLLEMLARGIERNIDQKGLTSRWKMCQRLAEYLPIDRRRHLFRGLHATLGSELRFVLCGGAALPDELAQWWERIGVHVIEGYGSTECSPVIASTTYDERVSGTVGRALDGVEVKVTSDGEVCVRGPNVSPGYWNDEERTAASFTPDRWFRTGDVGEISGDGLIRITGRLSDRIVLTSGMKVYPADVEEQINMAHGVEECAVISLPGPTGHEGIHAVLRMRQNMDGEAAAEAVQSANSRLATHQKVTTHSLWTEGDLPRSNLGKLKRSAIREMLISSRREAKPPSDPSGAAQSQASAGHPNSTVVDLLMKVAPGSRTSIDPRSHPVRDLGLDSLAQVELIAAIEERYGIELDESRLMSVRDVGDLEELIKREAGTFAPSAFSEWQLGNLSSMARSALQTAILFPLTKLVARPFSVTGLQNLAGLDGPVLLTPNHSSHVDTLSILRALPSERRRTTAVAAASDYFYRFRLAGMLSSLVLNAFPFSRAGHVSASLERCGELVDRGYSILVFPEGSRAPEGALLPFKSGIGLLARGLGVPLVPVAVSGGHKVLPKGAVWPSRAAVRVAFGRPVPIAKGASPQEIAMVLHRHVADLLREAQAHEH